MAGQFIGVLEDVKDHFARTTQSSSQTTRNLRKSGEKVAVFG